MIESIFRLLDTLGPKDRGSKKLAADVAYGRHARQKLDVYAPVIRNRVLPVIAFFYGGSWMDGDRRFYQFAGRALAALGYIVVIADYRVLPDVEYPGFLDDGFRAFEWIVSNIASFGGDPERIALVGHSAGAYNAVMLALDKRYLIDNGHLKRLRGVAGLSGPYDFFPFDVDISIRTFGAVRDGRSTQPIQHVSPEAPPMFLATGTHDSLVGPHNTINLAERLRAAGVQVTEKHYQGLGHAAPLLALNRIWRRKAPVLSDLAQFLAARLN
ncbi:MAG TPA: alpha/beta hydrolase [Arsenicitalea sp.]|jgi:acetyl esterase/lipase|nr:alpha/beta hydrolase [Arsenicitalea sp.]